LNIVEYLSFQWIGPKNSEQANTIHLVLAQLSTPENDRPIAQESKYVSSEEHVVTMAFEQQEKRQKNPNYAV
jgi:hypothetical protein